MKKMLYKLKQAENIEKHSFADINKYDMCNLFDRWLMIRL